MVSILMPAYNAARFIKDAIESVLAQSFEDWELIIVDDKSTDDTYSVAQKYEKKDNRIHVFQLKHNSGNPQIPRKEAFTFSTGDLIARLDADDFWEKDYLKLLTDRQKKTSADLVCDRGTYVYEDGSGIPGMKEEVQDYETVFSGRDICRRTIGGWYVSGRGILKRSVHERALDMMEANPDSMSADEIFVRQSIICCDKVAFAPALYSYRLHDGSITKKFSLRRFSYLENENDVVNFVIKNYGKDDPAYTAAVAHYYFTILDAARLYVDNKKTLSPKENRKARKIIVKNWHRLDSRELKKVSLKIWFNYLLGPSMFLCRKNISRCITSTT